MRLTRRQKKRLKNIVGEIGAGILVCGMMVALILAWLFSEPDEVEVPEHYNQIYYSGVWWDIDDYNAMMEEREAYMESEAAEEESYFSSITSYVERQAAAECTDATQIIGSLDWDADESYMLAKIAMAEAEGEDTEGKALVILVILNRVWSDGFPNTIEEVIMEDGQFTPIMNGRYDSVEPDEDSWAALEMVESGWDESEGATYFEATPEDGQSTWHQENLTELFTHGGHTFYTE